MPRKLKPYKVDSIRTRKGSVDMYLDREDQIFFGKVGPTRFQAPTAEECRKQLRKAMSEWDGLVWKQFIYLEASSGESSHNYCGFYMDNMCLHLQFFRFEGAKTLDGSWVRRKFKEDTPGGKKYYDPDKMDPWWGGPDDEEEQLVPYSEEAWAALHKIKGAIEIAGRQLEKLANAKNLPQLIAGGVKLLEAPSTKRSKKKKRR